MEQRTRPFLLALGEAQIPQGRQIRNTGEGKPLRREKQREETPRRRRRCQTLNRMRSPSGKNLTLRTDRNELKTEPLYRPIGSTCQTEELTKADVDSGISVSFKKEIRELGR